MRAISAVIELLLPSAQTLSINQPSNLLQMVILQKHHWSKQNL